MEIWTINASNLKMSKTAVQVILWVNFLFRYQSHEPREALGHFGGQYGTRSTNTVKTANRTEMCKMCQFQGNVQSQTSQKQHVQVDNIYIESTVHSIPCIHCQIL